MQVLRRRGVGLQADFLLFPELFTTQLLSTIKADRPGLSARMLAEFNERYIELFRDLAIRYHINIVGGSQFELESEHLFKSAFLFRRDGSIDKQRKLHITPEERKWWGVEPGDRLRTFDTDRGRIAVLVGYDVEFPELARIAYDQGAQILFVPINVDERHSYLRARYCARRAASRIRCSWCSRAVSATCRKSSMRNIHYSQSVILTPSDFYFSRDGIAAESEPNIETVIFAELDLVLLQPSSAKAGAAWEDRRRTCIRSATRGHGAEEV